MPFPQTLQDAATVWIETAATVIYTPNLCRNYAIPDIKNTLFYRDPLYVAVAATAKHVSNNSTAFADIVSTDWGRKASDLRDDDARSITKVIRCLLTAHVPNTPFLFPESVLVFTAAQVNTCMGFTSMSENALVRFQGGWWQHRVHDDLHRLLSPNILARMGRTARQTMRTMARMGSRKKCPCKRPQVPVYLAGTVLAPRKLCLTRRTRGNWSVLRSVRES